jgi:PiT family inorganic phosphate transporter
VSKGIATLIGSGLAKPAPAILWGAFWTLAGSIAAAFWGSVLAASFAHGYLATDFRPDTAFIAGALSGAFGWVGIATRLGLPESTTHGLLGGIAGAALSEAGPGGIEWRRCGRKSLTASLGQPIISHRAVLRAVVGGALARRAHAGLVAGLPRVSEVAGRSVLLR